MKIEYIWLDGSKHPDAPIKRQLRITFLRWTIKIPRGTVDWSRKPVK